VPTEKRDTREKERVLSLVATERRKDSKNPDASIKRKHKCLTKLPTTNVKKRSKCLTDYRILRSCQLLLVTALLKEIYRSKNARTESS
jgi:hypothetical protein